MASAQRSVAVKIQAAAAAVKKAGPAVCRGNGSLLNVDTIGMTGADLPSDLAHLGLLPICIPEKS